MPARLILVISILVAGTNGACADNLPEGEVYSDARAVFDMAKAYSTDGPVYSYDIEYDVDDFVASGTVNPAAREGERLTITSPPQDQWSEEFAAKIGEYEQNLDDGIWCQTVMDDYTGFEEASRDGNVVTYRVIRATEADDDDGDGNGENAAARFIDKVVTTIRLSADDGAVLEYTLHAPKPFRPALIAKIKQLDIRLSCARAPDGRTYVSSMLAEIKGRAMMKSFSQRESRKISNLRLPAAD